LDTNLSVVLVAVVGILPMTITSVLTFIQTRRTELAQAKRAEEAAIEVRNVATKVEKAREQQAVQATATAVEVEHVAATLAVDRKAWGQNQERTDEKLDSIHTLVNSRLTQALDTIEELKIMLKSLAPNDERVQKLLK
jgi:hypothetical protein